MAITALLLTERLTCERCRSSVQDRCFKGKRDHATSGTLLLAVPMAIPATFFMGKPLLHSH